MRLRIERHRSGTALGICILLNAEFIGGLFLDDRQRAVALRTENLLRPDIKNRGVNAFADRQRSHHLAAVGIEDDHQLVMAAHE